MKKRVLLYSMTLTVGVALIVGIHQWTTAAQDTPPRTQRSAVQQVPIATDTPAPSVTSDETVPQAATPTVKKKKACACCADRKARMKEHIKKARERKSRTRTAAQ